MPPQVQSLDQILASLEPAYAASRGLYNQQLSALPGQEAAATASLDVAKGNAFRDVNTNANSKGLAFSGIPAAEQTRYLGEKYLPAVAEVKSNTQKQQFTLQQALASLESDKYKTGLDTRTRQQSVLDQYLEAERDRAFKAQQAQQERAFTASENAANRAASSGGRAPTAAEVKQAVASHIVDNFNKLRGRDGKVANETWANALNDWTTAGGTVQQFWRNYSSYVNPKYKTKYAGYRESSKK